ncbi:MAG: hypothetical protein RSB11_06500 [Oscillospiraceae bacterium]
MKLLRAYKSKCPLRVAKRLFLRVAQNLVFVYINIATKSVNLK